MKPIIFMLLAVVFIFACLQPTPAVMITAAPTLQTYPTITMTPLATATSLPSPTSTPDVRIVIASAQNFKLRLEDLPAGYTIRFVPMCGDDTDPQCRLATDFIEGPQLNYEILQDYGFETGSRYINDTQRVEGWYIRYSNDSYNNYPETILSNPIRFTTTEGARKFVETYDGLLLDKYTKVEDYVPIGDSSIALSRTYYRLKFFSFAFSYKNIAHSIGMIGTPENITRDLVYDLAFKSLKRMQAAELNFPPQFTFLPTLIPPADITPRAITADLLDLALSEFDLPVGGDYYLPDKYASSPYHNNEILQSYERGKGGMYINATGRVDGWGVYYKRRSNDILLPVEMYDNVIKFQSAEGAQKYMTEFAPDFFEEGWREGVPQNKIGDATRIFIKQDGVFVKYALQFSFRNYAHRLQAYGLQAEIDPAFVEMVAFTLLRKIQSAP